jgi:cation diffusion facilitator CzcD-associated flavoprotein CzcO
VRFVRADVVGGLWRDNRYPGCACDVQSRLYSFSFAPNPRWSRRYPPRAEIWQYLQRCAAEFEIEPHLRFGHEVRDAQWDERVARWRILTSQGPFTADVLVAAVGALSEPRMPDLPGLGSFSGRVLHSARWDDDVRLAGRRVAVVGTGASAIQIVPAIQPVVERLVLFQRTPAWVVPRLDQAPPIRIDGQTLDPHAAASAGGTWPRCWTPWRCRNEARPQRRHRGDHRRSVRRRARHRARTRRSAALPYPRAAVLDLRAFRTRRRRARRVVASRPIPSSPPVTAGPARAFTWVPRGVGHTACYALETDEQASQTEEGQ